MTHEEMERSIEFVLQQQARFASDMQQLTAFGAELAKGQIRLQNGLAEVAAAQKVTETRLAEVAERLNVFIGVVERHIGGNGERRKSD